jgi:hypothetical protein
MQQGRRYEAPPIPWLIKLRACCGYVKGHKIKELQQAHNPQLVEQQKNKGTYSD